MKFVKSVQAAATASAAVLPGDLDLDSPHSIRNVAATLAYDTMTYYHGNTSSNPIDTGDLQDPYYWWVAGALWGAMLDYYHYTEDPSYNDVVLEALLAPTNLGPNHDYMPQEHAFEEGNDDLSFWGGAALSAAERNFPQPNSTLPSWLEISANVFNSLVSRWHTEKCGGGLLWQIYPDNPNGMTYKNSISNGGLFQIAARLARATGNDTYVEWAEKVWDWSMDVGLIDHEAFHVYDGTDIGNNCSDVNHASYTYTSGVYLLGASVLANYTEKPEWKKRTENLLDGAGWFFSPYKNATNIMYQPACETINNCNADMLTQKGYLSRYMWQSTQMVPSLRPKVEKLLNATSMAAAKSCTGGEDKRLCGARWYVGGYDGNKGLGQEMCALETIQGLMIRDAAPPLAGKDIKTVRNTHWKPLDESKPDPGNDNDTETGNESDSGSSSLRSRLGNKRSSALSALISAWRLA